MLLQVNVGRTLRVVAGVIVWIGSAHWPDSEVSFSGRPGCVGISVRVASEPSSILRTSWCAGRSASVVSVRGVITI